MSEPSTPLILVTNDDGIHSAGLTILAKALSRLGEVWVVAPDRERTAVAHAVTLHKPLRVHEMAKRVYAINGTPVDCVNLALLNILPRRPHLLVSGINKGVNLGDDVLYSGTVSAAVEGTILGVPSMAVSQEGREQFHFVTGAYYARRVARLILAARLAGRNTHQSECPGSCLGIDQRRPRDVFEPAAIRESYHPEGRSSRQDLLLDRRNARFMEPEQRCRPRSDRGRRRFTHAAPPR